MTQIRLTSELAARGFTPYEVDRMARAGELVRVRRGAYTETVGADARERHRQLIAATLLQCASSAVVSHESAAVLHGLPVWGNRLDRVDLTSGSAGGGRYRRCLRMHGLPLPPEQVTTVADLRVTSLARTVLDVACQLPVARAVAIGDAALRAGLDPEELNRLLDRTRGRHGINAARRAIPLLDARAESAGESWSRVLLHQRGVPTPEPQLSVYGANAALIGRCDFGWRESRTVGEFDGRVKYGRGLRPGQDIEQVLWAEKLREDALRDLGWQVVRWTWSELADPDAMLARLSRAFERGRRG